MKRTDTAPDLPTISGKSIILTIGILALAGAIFAWWYRYEQFDESVVFWGPTAAELIAEDRSEVELLRLTPLEEGENGSDPQAAEGEAPLERLPVAGEFYGVQDRATAEDIKGLVHLRFALTQDASFDFENPPEENSAPWPYAMRFTHGEDTVLVLFDPANHRAGLPGGKSVRLRGKFDENLGGYFEEVFAEPGE